NGSRVACGKRSAKVEAETSASSLRNSDRCCWAGCRTTGNRRCGTRLSNWTSGCVESCAPCCGDSGNAPGPVRKPCSAEACPGRGPGSPQRMAEVPGGMRARATCTRRSPTANSDSLDSSACSNGHSNWHVPTEPPYTEPYVRWCGRTAGATPPPTRCCFSLLSSTPHPGVAVLRQPLMCYPATLGAARQEAHPLIHGAVANQAGPLLLDRACFGTRAAGG